MRGWKNLEEIARKDGRAALNLNEFMESKDDGVFIIGHASALVRINQELILFDPIWKQKPYGEQWTFVPEQIDCDHILSQIKYCVISHIHSDHVCGDILRRFRGHTTVLIMSGRPDLRNKILGFGCHVLEVEEGAWKDLQGLKFFFVPHAFNTVDSSCLIRSDTYCVYVGNDNFLSADTLERLKTELDASKVKIDVALVPYAFIHYYPWCMGTETMTGNEKAQESRRLNEQSLKQADMFIDILKPVLAIPTGAALFYDHGADHPLNCWLARPHIIKNSVPMIAGDFILGDLIYKIPQTMEDYDEMLITCLGHGKPKEPINCSVFPKFSNVVAKRVMQAQVKIPGYKILVNNLLIDLESLKTILWEDDVDTPHIRFRFDRSVFEKWHKGFITFEEAIGTRLFVYDRFPNEYRLDVTEWYNQNL